MKIVSTQENNVLALPYILILAQNVVKIEHVQTCAKTKNCHLHQRNFLITIIEMDIDSSSQWPKKKSNQPAN